MTVPGPPGLGGAGARGRGAQVRAGRGGAGRSGGRAADSIVTAARGSAPRLPPGGARIRTACAGLSYARRARQRRGAEFFLR